MARKHPLKEIFPNADIKSFEHYLKSNKGDIDFSLYSYGGIRKGEYAKERKELSLFYEKKRRKAQNPYGGQKIVFD